MLFAPCGVARAQSAEVTSDTAAQFYDLRSPTGGVVLERRRLTTTLGVTVDDLFRARAEPRRQKPPPEIRLRARLRYDADYGASGAEESAAAPRFLVPGFSRGPVDLMYGYVEGRRWLDGVLGFRIGRQYVTDVLGMFSFDGGLVRIDTPAYLALEAYGGLEQRGGLFLATGRYERDGIWRGNRAGYDPSLEPAFQPAAIAPAYGAALEFAGFPWLHARASYRRVNNTGATNTTLFASALHAPVAIDDVRVSQERVGVSVDATAADLGTARAAFAYDLFVDRVASAYASVDAFPAKDVTVSVDYDYYQPIFDGDSIFNLFPAEPTSDLGIRAAWTASSHLSLAGGANARAFQQATGPEALGTAAVLSRSWAAAAYPSNGVAFNEGGNLAAKYGFGNGNASVRGAGNAGDGGYRFGADIAGQRIVESRYVLEGRASFWRWDDKLRPDRSATSFGYVAGLGYRFATRSQAMIEWEHTINRLVGQRFRVVVWLTVAVAR